MDNTNAVLADDSVSYSLAAPTPPTVCIKANDGRTLLTINPDGTVTGEIENASEAARVFVESLRRYLRQPTQPDALREAVMPFTADATTYDADYCTVLVRKTEHEALRKALEASNG